MMRIRKDTAGFGCRGERLRLRAGRTMATRSTSPAGEPRRQRLDRRRERHGAADAAGLRERGEGPRYGMARRRERRRGDALCRPHGRGLRGTLEMPRRGFRRPHRAGEHDRRGRAPRVSRADGRSSARRSSRPRSSVHGETASASSSGHRSGSTGGFQAAIAFVRHSFTGAAPAGSCRRRSPSGTATRAANAGLAVAEVEDDAHRARLAIAGRECRAALGVDQRRQRRRQIAPVVERLVGGGRRRACSDDRVAEDHALDLGRQRRDWTLPIAFPRQRSSGVKLR